MTESFRILLVDDEPASMELLSESLLDRGFSVDFEKDAMKALSRLKQPTLPPPHLIVMDVNMPHVNGVEVSSMIKADPQFSKIPIIVLSGYISGRQMSSALSAGCDDVMTKPYEINEIIAKIEKHLRVWT